MNKKYVRSCPKCNSTIEYKWYTNWWAANKKNSACCKCTNKQNAQIGRLKNSESHKGKKLRPEHKAKVVTAGQKNILQGSVYDFWIKKYGIKEADRRMLAFKEKQSRNNSGENNPMYGKPSPQGSGNGWSGWYQGWFFRSFRELKFVLGLNEHNISWVSAERKEFKVEYKDVLGKKRNYFPDFLVEQKKIVECKPKKLWFTPNVLAKTKAAKSFFEKRGLEFELVDPGTFEHEKIKALIDSGTVVLTKRYQEKWMEKYNDETSDYS